MIALEKSAAPLPPAAPVVRQPPPNLSTISDMRIELAPLAQEGLWAEYSPYCRLLYER